MSAGENARGCDGGVRQELAAGIVGLSTVRYVATGWESIHVEVHAVSVRRCNPARACCRRRPGPGAGARRVDYPQLRLGRGQRRPRLHPAGAVPHLECGTGQDRRRGTISIIDAAGYGTVTIDKAINIINDGAGTASILVPQGETGVFVKDPFYEARVYLRGLTIEGANVGSTGVFVAGARAVSVENCVIRNLFGGILF